MIETTKNLELSTEEVYELSNKLSHKALKYLADELRFLHDNGIEINSTLVSTVINMLLMVLSSFSDENYTFIIERMTRIRHKMKYTE